MTTCEEFERLFAHMVDSASAPPAPPAFSDLTLEGLAKVVASLPRIRPLTIVVTSYVFEPYIIENAEGRFIVTDHQSAESLISMVTPSSGNTLVSYAGVPVIYDDTFAALLIARNLISKGP